MPELSVSTPASRFSLQAANYSRRGDPKRLLPADTVVKLALCTPDAYALYGITGVAIASGMMVLLELAFQELFNEIATNR
jgi:hypothetical protein